MHIHIPAFLLGVIGFIPILLLGISVAVDREVNTSRKVKSRLHTAVLVTAIIALTVFILVRVFR